MSSPALPAATDQQLLSDDQLTSEERTLLASLETIIDQNLHSFMKTGEALRTIRLDRLYRQTHKTFEDYCRERWDVSRPTAYRLIDSVEVVKIVSQLGDIPLPANVEQTRILAPLKKKQDKLKEVWGKVVTSGETISAKLVREKAEPYLLHRSKDAASESPENTLNETAANAPSALQEPPARIPPEEDLKKLETALMHLFDAEDILPEVKAAVAKLDSGTKAQLIRLAQRLEKVVKASSPPELSAVA
jgi:hypothetical protein